MFLIGDPPHRAEPRSQRKMTAVEDGPGRDRRLMPAPCAHQEAPLGHPSVCVDSALGALEPRWPAQRHQIGSAGCIRREPSFEVGQCPRVVLHAEERYRLWPLESSGYPISTNVLALALSTSVPLSLSLSLSLSASLLPFSLLSSYGFTNSLPILLSFWRPHPTHELQTFFAIQSVN